MLSRLAPGVASTGLSIGILILASHYSVLTNLLALGMRRASGEIAVATSTNHIPAAHRVVGN
jgi:hypothetical protein